MDLDQIIDLILKIIIPIIINQRHWLVVETFYYKRAPIFSSRLLYSVERSPFSAYSLTLASFQPNPKLHHTTPTIHTRSTPINLHHPTQTYTIPPTITSTTSHHYLTTNNFLIPHLTTPIPHTLIFHHHNTTSLLKVMDHLASSTEIGTQWPVRS